MNKQQSSEGKFRTYNTLLNVLWYFTLLPGILFLLVTVAGSIYLFSSGKALSDYTSLGIQLTGPGIGAMISSRYFGPEVLASMLINAYLAWGLLLFLLYQFRNIFTRFIKEGSPFTDDSLKRVKSMAKALLFYSPISFAVGALHNLLLSPANSLIDPEGVKLYIKIGFPVWPLMCGIVLLLLVELFGYGLKVQQDNDSIV